MNNREQILGIASRARMIADATPEPMRPPDKCPKCQSLIVTVYDYADRPVVKVCENTPSGKCDWSERQA